VPGKLDRLQFSFAALNAVAALVAGILVFTDTREILGVPLWMKPFKFFVSTVLMSLSLAYIIPRIEKAKRLVQIASKVIVIAFGIELALISWAAASETTSHFNVSSPLAISVWTAMAGFITAVWVATILLTIFFLRYGAEQPVMKRAISWGMGISIIGMGVAFLMTGPTSAQLADWQGIAGAHTVGAADGGPGLPLFGWSTIAGDLRIPHFFGLHALQALPLFALVLRGRVSKLSVDLFGVGYTVVIALLTAQALAQQSIVDTPTWMTAVMIAALVAPIVLALIKKPEATKSI
jgi:hypothetical protein